MITELAKLAQSLGTSLAVLAVVLSVQVLLILLLRKPVRAWLGATASYRLWLLPILWLPFYATGSFVMVWVKQLLGSAPEPGLSIAAKPLAQPSADGWFDLPELSINFDTVIQPVAPGVDWMFLLESLWLAGCVVLLLWYCIKLAQFSRHVQRHARPAANAKWQKVMQASSTGRAIPVLTLPGLASAALFGIVKPVLLLPESFTANYDTDQQHIMLAHEAVHWRRNDNLWTLIASLVVALLWWNPLLWLALRCYRADQELSCDAQALTLCSQQQRQRYASTLLDAVTMQSVEATPVLVSWNTLRDLKERTLMIEKHLTNVARPITTLILLAVIALTGGIVTIVLSATSAPIAAAAEIGQQEITPQTAGVGVSADSIELQLDASRFLPMFRSSSEKERETMQSMLARSKDMLGKIDNKPEEQMNVLLVKTALMMNMMAHESLGQLDEARAAAMQALQLKGTDFPREDELFRSGLAQISMREEKWQQASEELTAFLNLPSLKMKWEGLYLLAICYYRLNKPGEALATIEQAVELENNLAEKPDKKHLEMLSTLYLQQQRWADAAPVLQQMENFYPRDEVVIKRLQYVESAIKKGV